MLSDREWTCMHLALMAPALWRFAVVAAADGISAAVEACRSGVSEKAAKALEEAGYDCDLPPHGDMVALLLACRIRAARKPKQTAERAGAGLGISEVDSRYAMVVWDRYAQVSKHYRARGDIEGERVVVDSKMLGGL